MGRAVCGLRVEERFPAGLQAGGVFDLCVVAVPEGGAPVWRERQLPASSSGETEGRRGYLFGAQSRSPAFPDSWHPLLQVTR